MRCELAGCENEAKHVIWAVVDDTKERRSFQICDDHHKQVSTDSLRGLSVGWQTKASDSEEDALS